jgi:hypothetical protein
MEEPVAEGEKVTPLTRAIYDKMPHAMQKMTLMDKVVVITGYVFCCFTLEAWH